MSARKRHTVTLSESLNEVAEICRKQNRYRNISELLNGFLRFWALSMTEHHLSAEWAALSDAEQDDLDDGLLESVKNKKIVKGSWFKAEIFEAVEQWIRENESYPRTKPLAKKLAERIAALAQERPAKNESREG